MECCSNVARRKKVDLSDPQKIMNRGYKDLMWLHPPPHGGLKLLNTSLIHTMDYIDICTPILTGSSTACILSYNSDTGLLRVANLGDSGFLTVRNQSIIGESSETIHSFNCPYQLSNPPPGYDSMARDR